jgi:hypothetical protein
MPPSYLGSVWIKHVGGMYRTASGFETICARKPDRVPNLAWSATVAFVWHFYAFFFPKDGVR